MDDIILSSPSPSYTVADYDTSGGTASEKKKNLVVIYDGGDHSDVVMKTTSWLEHSGLFKVNVLAITNKETLLKEEDHLSGKITTSLGNDYEQNKKKDNEDIVKDLEKQEFLANVGVEFNRIILTEESEKDAEQSAHLIQAAVNAAQPDIVVTGASIRKFSLFDSPQFIALIDRLNCPVIIARDFTIPGVNIVKTALNRILRK